MAFLRFFRKNNWIIDMIAKTITNFKIAKTESEVKLLYKKKSKILTSLSATSNLQIAAE